MGEVIYIVGMASVYAGAADLSQFWESVLTRRRGFRDFPKQRMDLAEYGSDLKSDKDKTNVKKGAFIDGYQFDWKRHRVPKAAFEATDLAHWLALTTAIEAIKDAAVDLDAVGRERIGVVLGNSLTGEISRANMLRLRWPYMRKAMIEGAARAGIEGSELARLIDEVEASFKGAFPAPNEDTLAGVLSNVIAGRICNMLDLGGGGYVVDGACASSLLAVSQACEALSSGQLDMALAGGVDISLDPLEMVGFARTGALTTQAMRVYDRDSAGFLPGEGCGMVALMRAGEVERLGLTPWARLAGWGISSDGAGGITAPKASGQAIAQRRCYERAGFAPATLDFIEGHGTGTPVGDRQELLGFLATLGTEEGQAETVASPPRSTLRRTGVTSVKTLLGHTKAAAGAAGLIKAALAVNQRVLPPMAGLRQRAEAFAQPGAPIYPLSHGLCRDADTTLRAGVSGAGFGGINCHVAVSSEGVARRELSRHEATQLLASAQEAELFIASAGDLPTLRRRLEELLEMSEGMAEGELVDLAVHCARRDRAGGERAAIVAESVDELRQRLDALLRALEGSGAEPPTAPPGCLLGRANRQLRIGLLIPGQGSQFLGMGERLKQCGGWATNRRARWDTQLAGVGEGGLTALIDRPLERADSAAVIKEWNGALRDTRVAQPAIVMTSLQWIQWLRQIGVTANAVVGHSLGEITALVVARALSESEAIEIVRLRGEACAAEGVEAGGMLALKCDLERANALLMEVAGYAIVANDNAPDQVVVAGEPEALRQLTALATERAVESRPLEVSKAFHTRHMAPAAASLRTLAQREGESRSLSIPLFSSLHGAAAPNELDPFAYCAEQITAPVRFREALLGLSEQCDLLLEVGPGSVLSGLARRTLGERLPICALEPRPSGSAAGETDARFCRTIGQLFVAGAALDWEAFYEERYHRPFTPASERSFIENPCSRESEVDLDAIPGLHTGLVQQQAARTREQLSAAMPTGSTESMPPPERQTTTAVSERGATLAEEIDSVEQVEMLLRQLIARETGYDLEMIEPSARLGADLNLDSIKISEVQAELRRRGVELPEGLPLGTLPICEIAKGAHVRQRASAQTPARPEGQSGQTPPPELEQAPMPKGLPVLGYARRWRVPAVRPERSIESSTQTRQLPSPLLLLHAPERAAEAQALVERLSPFGLRIILDDASQPTAAVSEAKRLMLLPGACDQVEAVSPLFARVGRYLAADCGSLLLISRPTLAPVFGFAQSISLERPRLPILAIEMEEEASITDLAELAIATIEPGVRLQRSLSSGKSRELSELTLEPWAPAGDASIPLTAGDLVVITGGGKGITAECAFTLLRATAARALLLGRSSAADDEVRATLARMREAGLQARYLSCDVSDRDALQGALAEGRAQFDGAPIVGLLHGAGVNLPTPIGQLDAAAVAREYRIKVGALEQLLAAVDPAQLKLCVAIGSVIGVIGMRGNSGYALANEALAATLQRFKAAYPRVQVACPAFSVWAELGMGAKLNVLDALERQHVAAIPVAEGVRWFMHSCAERDLPIPLVVAAPMHGLPTWRQARATEQLPSALAQNRYLTQRIVHEPGACLVTRPRLDPRQDRGLREHNFRGSLLFATVEALYAFGSGAQLLESARSGGEPTDGAVARVVRFEALRIQRAIVATAEGETPIELDLRHPERDWEGRIGQPGLAWSEPAFSVRCSLGQPAAGGGMAPDDHTGWRPVAQEVGPHLYDALLFQGPIYQRIQALEALDLSDSVRRRGRFLLRRDASARHAAIPDRYFLDAMLQSVQVLVPRDLCLPVGIDEIHFTAEAWNGGLARVEAEISERNERGYVTRVRAWDRESGALLVRLEGYRVNIVERMAARPDADALFEPLARDRAAVSAWLEGQGDHATLSIALGPIDDSDPIHRRDSAAQQLAEQLGIAPTAFRWAESGAPSRIDRPGEGVSISHDAGRLLTVAGVGRLGCDLQRIGTIPRPWGELLPSIRLPLWRALTARLRDGDVAGGMVWAIHEALIKAGAAERSLQLLPGEESGAPPRFAFADHDASEAVILAGVLELTLAGRCAIALVRLSETAIDPLLPAQADAASLTHPSSESGVSGNPSSTGGSTNSGSTGLESAASAARVSHYTRLIEMTFKEALPPFRSPTPSIFFSWMGSLREEAMASIREPLAHAFGEGGKGMVTNGTRVRVARPIRFSAALRAWVWLERVLETQPSTFELGFAWAECDRDGAPRQLVAQGSQRLTWVDISPQGHVQIEPFPDFFAEFIAARTPASGSAPFAPPLPYEERHSPLLESADRTAEGESLRWRQMPGAPPHGLARQTLESDETHSNFVGNIYFAHAGALAERTCQKALRQLAERAGMSDRDTPLFATALQLDHLGEAMPGDLLEAEVQLSQIAERSCCLDITLFNRSHGEAKIATGRARYRRFAIGAESGQPNEMPAWLLPSN